MEHHLQDNLRLWRGLTCSQVVYMDQSCHCDAQEMIEIESTSWIVVVWHASHMGHGPFNFFEVRGNLLGNPSLSCSQAITLAFERKIYTSNPGFLMTTNDVQLLPLLTQISPYMSHSFHHLLGVLQISATNCQIPGLVKSFESWRMPFS
jgi:hypothetical protein